MIELVRKILQNDKEQIKKKLKRIVLDALKNKMETKKPEFLFKKHAETIINNCSF
jgi:FKBP-type peptidyl-prolyl cis-trans isomerase (trigger factor)